MSLDCQHHRIDNETAQCIECGERMVTQQRQVKTVLSAPNLAPGSGTYVPDRSREREVPVEQEFTYECERCGNPGAVISSEGYVPDCGHVHRGDSIPIRNA